MPVLDIDHVLGKPRNRVARIGVELEGAWEKTPIGTRIERDGSVFHDNPPMGMRAGEIPIGPIVIAQLEKALTKFFPNAVDETCGMHVHMSFDSVLHYSLLADSIDYKDTILEYFHRWGKKEELPVNHPHWARIFGNSEFAQNKFWPDRQIIETRKRHNRDGVGHRYTVINYCWGRTRTLECRVLPMYATPPQCFRAIKHLIDITNAYLTVVRKKTRIKLGSKVELSNGFLYEEHVENV